MDQRDETGTDQRDETRSNAGSDAEPGRMLARTWVIAANFRTPDDYGIPTAPTFRAERRADGTLVLVDPESSETVLTAKRPSRVRR